MRIVRIPDKVLVRFELFTGVRPPRTHMAVVSKLPVGNGAYIGTVVVDNPDDYGLIMHELVHAWQHDKIGWKFPFLYLAELLAKGYKNSKYEVEARWYQSKF